MKGDGLDRWRTLRGAICVAVALYLIAPLVIVVIISFSAASFLQFPPPGLSLRWYRNLFNDPAWTDALTVSIQILIPSATLATLLGTAAAYALVRGRIPGASVIGAALMLPIIVPGIITAAALFGAYRGLGLNGTLTGLIIGHVIITMPYVVATVSSALRTLDPRLEDAAATLGAPPFQAFRRVTLPLLLPAILSGLLFAAVASFDELIVSLFVSSARVRPVAVQMWSNIRGDMDPTIAAIASLCFAFALVALLVESILRRRTGVERT
ncbi:ABC transporter permease [Phreatobacter stygius]|uniref:ABC transporter permease n=1 Tax=Phreatobacter stygius TaxID=1940610 RepID=A0A4D7B1N3_9HYPH|nr:ABC transporter permease [Phreatobacter stygius]QCI67629.1 ABC transporter permease [Phreatobacter stygius]